MLDIEKLEEQLFEMQDLKYRDFHSKLLPGIDKETLIGIRTPMLRKFAKEFAKTPEKFLNAFQGLRDSMALSGDYKET